MSDLKLEAGKFYETKAGEKFGPMEMWMDDAEHPWQQEGGTFVLSEGGDIWRKDGTSHYVDDLVKEVTP